MKTPLLTLSLVVLIALPACDLMGDDEPELNLTTGRVHGVSLGMSFRRATTVLRGCEVSLLPAINCHAGRHKGINVYPDVEGVVTHIRVGSSYAGSTEQGIHTGMSYRSVVVAIGPPDQVISVGPTATYLWRFPTHFVVLDFREPDYKLTAINIRPLS